MRQFVKFLLNKVISTFDKSFPEYDFAQMPEEELLALGDDDFYEFLLETLKEEDFPAFMHKEAANVLAVMTYEMEMNNGGIDQFFENSSRVYAPFVSDALGAIGAAQHKSYFDDLVNRTGLDLWLLATPEGEEETAISQKQEEIRENLEDTFNAFDFGFYDIEEKETLSNMLNAYARKHIARMR